MVDTDKLRGLIAERGMSQATISKRLGMSPSGFYLKMRKGVFDSDEISELITILDIKDPMRIFFSEFGA